MLSSQDFDLIVCATWRYQSMTTSSPFSSCQFQQQNHRLKNEKQRVPNRLNQNDSKSALARFGSTLKKGLALMDRINTFHQNSVIRFGIPRIRNTSS